MSAAPETEELHYCPFCLKGYKRREHLQRHRITHNADRPYCCNTCDAAFKRTDVLKRHMETCGGRHAQHVQATRKRRSCDRCVRQKKACNACSPCQNCQKRSVPCQYSRPGRTSGPSTSTTADPSNSSTLSTVLRRSNDTVDVSSSLTRRTSGLYEPFCQSLALPFPLGHNWGGLGLETVPDLSLERPGSYVADTVGQMWSTFTSSTYKTGTDIQPFPGGEACPSAPSNQGYSFHFLADFTSRTGLVSSFDCGTPAQRREAVSIYAQSAAGSLNAAVPLLSLSGDDVASGLPELSGLNWAWQSWLDNPMVIKLQQIVLRIKEVIVIKPRNSTVTLSWSPALEARCLDFFSVARFGKFMELYWSIWHPNVNFLHRPTFDPTNTPSTLLAAMAIIGACVSPDMDDNDDARLWFNCVEEMVFTHDHLCSDHIIANVDDHPVTCSIAASRRKLQALQAACIICLYQNWEGTDTSKRRIRRYRFGTVVSVARDIGISTAKHASYHNMAKHEFSWQEYAAREELIRTFLWVVLIDTAFVIFNNLPHRMVIKEMTMQMASPESCFQAPTAESCLEEIRQWMPDITAMCHVTLREAIEDLCVRTLPVQAQLRMAELGPLNLFAIVSSFHYMIFQHQNLTVVEGQLTPIHTALSNWKNVWVAYCAHFPRTALDVDSSNADASTMWMRIGFSRYCAEYWLLATLLVARISANTTQQHQLGGPDAGDCGGEPCHARLVEPVLDKYDQTSMRQVNDLITSFGKFQL